MSKKITEKVTWVGKIDWELTKFHGDEYSTKRGSSYNSYLIKDEKIALIDTVWLPYDKEFVAKLREEVDIKDIDYIIMNHNEVDHSGALPEILREIPDVPIYCTKKGEEILRGHYHQDWNFVNVKTGDTLCLGETTLTFIEATMLHWPDTMFTYMSGDNILFSNDGFGQHYASESLYADREKKSEWEYEALKYYVNILNMYSPMAKRKVNEIKAMNLPIDIIAPSHGVLFRENLEEVMDNYLKWADAYQENQITILYDSMWNNTRKMAEAMAEGIQSVDGDVKLKLINVAKEDKNDIMTEIFRSKAILVGSSTVNYGFTYAIAGILEMARGMKFKKKKAASFGSYGWTGEAPQMIADHLKEGGFEVVLDPIKVQWTPDDAAVESCKEFGRNFVEAIK